MSRWKTFAQTLTGLFRDAPPTHPEEAFQVRPARVKATALHRMSFVATPESGSFKIGNISVSGLALLAEDPAPPLEVGSELRGLLSFASESFEVVLEVRHNQGGVIGCRFLQPVQKLKQVIARYLRHEILALELRPVNPKYVKASEKGEVQWFSDGGHNELYVITKDARVVEFHCAFLGHYVEWSAGGLRFGDVVEESAEMGIKPAAMVSMTGTLPAETTATVLKVLAGIKSLAPATYAELQFLIEEAGEP